MSILKTISPGTYSTMSLGTTVECVYAQDDVDEDGDGLLDGYEIWDFGSSPELADTDGDGLDDYYEVGYEGTQPLVDNHFGTIDSDEDYWSDLIEVQTGTDPWNPDTDFDSEEDSYDATPLGTGGKWSDYGASFYPLHIGKYDITKTEGGTVTVLNPYTGLTKQETTGDDYTRYFYDAKGHTLATITHKSGKDIFDIYNYDADGNMTYLSHNGLAYKFTYSGGNLANVQVGGQSLVSYLYLDGADGTKVPRRTLYANGSGETAEYTDMDITSVTKDSDGNVTEETAKKSMKTAVSVDGNLAYSYTYDKYGNVKTLKDDRNGGVTYTYSYDADNNLTAISGDNGFSIGYNKQDTSDEAAGTSKHIDKTTYTVDGTTKSETYDYRCLDTSSGNYQGSTTLLSGGFQIKTVTGGGNTVEVRLENEDGILENTTVYGDNETTVTDSNGNATKYGYDSDGNITKVTAGGTTAAEYAYDAFDQLTQEKDYQNDRSASYTYDLNGNILTKSITQGSGTDAEITNHTYTYGSSSWRDLLTAYDGKAITYDASGNPLAYYDGSKFTWQDGRELASYESSRYTITYSYNADGMRTKKSVLDKQTGGKTVTEYQMDGSDIISQKTTVSKDGVTESENRVWFDYDGEDSLVGFQTDTGAYYYQKNLQGDVTGIMDSDGNQLVKYAYDAVGNVLSVKDNSGSGLAKSNPFGYRGYYRDDETGLYYLQSRYYDSGTGRFINADTTSSLKVSSSASDANLFAYGLNNPVINTDPTGYCINLIIGAIIGAFVAYIMYYVEWRFGLRKWSWGQLIAIIAVSAALSSFDWFYFGFKIVKIYKYMGLLERVGMSKKAIKMIRLLYKGRNILLKKLLGMYGKTKRSKGELLNLVRRIIW